MWRGDMSLPVGSVCKPTSGSAVAIYRVLVKRKVASKHLPSTNAWQNP